MTTLAKWALLAVAVLIAANVFLGYESNYAKGELARLTIEADSLRRVSARVDTVYKRDTLRFTRWRDSLVTLRESLTVTDTLEVVRFVAAQDSTIVACSAALLTCERRVGIRDERLAIEAGRFRALEATIPTRWDRLRRTGCAVVGGAGGGALGATVADGQGAAIGAGAGVLAGLVLCR